MDKKRPTDQSPEARRQRIRQAIERHEPGLVAFADAAKATFPAARLTELDVPAEGIAMRTEPVPYRHEPGDGV